jgi:hypothetical protein
MSYKDFPEFANAHINPMMSWLAYHGLASFVNSMVVKKVYVFPEGNKRQELAGSLKGKQLLHAYSHYGDPDPPIALYADSKFGLRHPLMLMTDDLGHGALAKFLKSLGGVEVKREIKIDGVLYKIYEHREGRRSIIRTKDFIRDKFSEGFDIAYSPAGQRSTNGFIDDSFGRQFGGVGPEAAEEFIAPEGKVKNQLDMLVCSITYDSMPDIFEQEKRLALGKRLSRKELLVNFGIAEREGDSYKTGLSTAFKGIIRRKFNPDSRPYGNAYVNFASVDLTGVMEKNPDERGKYVIRDAMLESMKASVMLPPSTIVAKALLRAGGVASQQQLEEIVGGLTDELLDLGIPTAPTVKKPYETISHAMPLLEKNRIVLPSAGYFMAGDEFALNYLSNVGKYHFDRLKQSQTSL